MSEYIEREALRAEAIRLTGGDEFVFDNCFPYWQFSKSIKEAPAADVAPVVHGRWIEAKVGGMSLYPDGQKMCSVCGQIMPSRWETMPPFCFGCGAKMNAESEAGK